MELIKDGRYRVKGDLNYFKRKYGTPNPVIILEAKDTEIWPNGGWGFQQGNPACLCFATRAGFGMLKDEGDVWYGHIEGLGELVYAYELEEVKDKDIRG